jgi:hypothetical protein
MLPTTLRDEATGTLRHTMRDGVVQDWDCLEALLHRTFYGRLGWEAGADEGAVLFSEQVLTPRRDRERLAALCFERFGLAGMFVAEAPVLALYSVGRSSGLVADVGHDGASVAAVVDGAAVAAASRRVTSGGGGGGEPSTSSSSSSSSSLSAPLGGLAAERVLRARVAARVGDERAGAIPEDALRAAKHAVCRVAASAAEAAGSRGAAAAAAAAAASAAAAGGTGAPSTAPSKHVLPDGTELEVTASDGAAAGEALVSPQFFLPPSGGDGSGGASGGSSADGGRQRQHPSLAELLSLALSSVPDANSRKLASEGLLVCGGGSNAPGLGARILAEGGGALPPSHPAPPPLLSVPDYVPASMAASAAWAGGAILARVVFQQQQHVSRAEYDEFGPTVVHRKSA